MSGLKPNYNRATASRSWTPQGGSGLPPGMLPRNHCWESPALSLRSDSTVFNPTGTSPAEGNDQLPVTKKVQAGTRGREETSSWNGQSPRKTPFNPQTASPGKEWPQTQPTNLWLVVGNRKLASVWLETISWECTGKEGVRGKPGAFGMHWHLFWKCAKKIPFSVRAERLWAHTSELWYQKTTSAYI